MDKDNNELEEITEARLDQEDKLRIVKGLLLMFLFASISNNI
jgi:hypothetical protein